MPLDVAAAETGAEHGNGQVQIFIVIELPGGHEGGPVPDRVVVCHLVHEVAATNVSQYGDARPVVIRHGQVDQVLATIFQQVLGDYAGGAATGRHVVLVMKRAVSVVQQHGDVAGSKIGHRHVEQIVVVQISKSDRLRTLTGFLLNHGQIVVHRESLPRILLLDQNHGIGAGAESGEQVGTRFVDVRRVGIV